jgi:hypothetical protein
VAAVLLRQGLRVDQVEVVAAANQPVVGPEALRFNQLQPQVVMEMPAEAAQTLLVVVVVVQTQPAAPTQGEPDENGLPDQGPITAAEVAAVMAQAALVAVALLVAPQAHQILAEVEGEDPEQVVLES